VTRWLIHCRPGFENDCAAELGAYAAAHGATGFARAKAEAAHLIFEADAAFAPTWSELCFARELWPVHAALELPETDRVGAILAALPPVPRGLSGVRLEHPDTNDGKALSVFCRKFTAPLERGLKAAGIRIDAPGAPLLHLFLTDSRHALLGFSDPSRSAPWSMGIARLKLPRAAPSRSTLKLEEAFLALLSEAERARWFEPGMTAVDLGAAPGGWTWQFVQRGVRVLAVDNGPMDAALLESGLVEHWHEDGFRYRPPRPVDWLVCDMVEQPQRVAQLIGDWLERGDAHRAIFNLKLPMKKRQAMVAECLVALRQRLPQAVVRAKQLYHDREEVTVFAGDAGDRA
jgi:23S rRNA (cytidine2498-2'-O)-methyltransferase